MKTAPHQRLVMVGDRDGQATLLTFLFEYLLTFKHDFEYSNTNLEPSASKLLRIMFPVTRNLLKQLNLNSKRKK